MHLGVLGASDNGAASGWQPPISYSMALLWVTPTANINSTTALRFLRWQA